MQEIPPDPPVNVVEVPLLGLSPRPMALQAGLIWVGVQFGFEAFTLTVLGVHLLVWQAGLLATRFYDEPADRRSGGSGRA
ncbi:hypothetical protein ACIOMM_29660 [Streptomyces sp. NPDC087908]|uniref:hypothetical protein n=2 Tax=unclassified Streptomyces TaxID=2593676 RepID=UPI0037FA75AA